MPCLGIRSTPWVLQVWFGFPDSGSQDLGSGSVWFGVPHLQGLGFGCSLQFAGRLGIQGFVDMKGIRLSLLPPRAGHSLASCLSWRFVLPQETSEASAQDCYLSMKCIWQRPAEP